MDDLAGVVAFRSAPSFRPASSVALSRNFSMGEENGDSNNESSSFGLWSSEGRFLFLESSVAGVDAVSAVGVSTSIITGAEGFACGAAGADRAGKGFEADLD
jgi:hypothetical protein